MNKPNRRREPRYNMDDLVVIKALRPPVIRLNWARIQDISRSGIRLQTTEPLKLKSYIQVQLNTIVVYGEVRYCKLSPAGEYEVGLKIATALARQAVLALQNPDVTVLAPVQA